MRETNRIIRVEMPRAHPRWGIEFDWLGVDRRGYVAVFTTVGYGAVPVDVNQHAADVDAALEQASGLPVTGSASDLVPSPADDDYSDWHAYSGKGLYAYDWRLWHGPYQRSLSPTVPVNISQLPLELQIVAHLAELPVSFADESEIILDYVEPPEPNTGHTPAT